MLDFITAAPDITQSAADVITAAGGGGFDSTGLRAWIIQNIVVLIVTFLGVMILLGARKGNWSKGIDITGVALLGCFVIAGAGLLYAFGGDIARMTFGG